MSQASGTMFDYPPGATPIDADEAEGLVPRHLTTQADLNEWEQANIATAAAWIRTSRLDPLDLPSVRPHLRPVCVHLFPNGNGRHARLWANWVLKKTGAPTIDWGGGLGPAGVIRAEYIAALRAADGGDYSPLLGLFDSDA